MRLIDALYAAILGMVLAVAVKLSLWAIALVLAVLS